MSQPKLKIFRAAKLHANAQGSYRSDDREVRFAFPLGEFLQPAAEN